MRQCDGRAARDVGLLGIYGSVISAAIFGILGAPFISRLLPLFQPVVTGSIILVIGVSLMRVDFNKDESKAYGSRRAQEARPSPMRNGGQLPR